MPRTMASNPSDSGLPYFSSIRSASWTISAISRSTGVAQEVVLLQEGFEGAILPSVGEPGPHHIEELRFLRCFRRIAEEGEGGIRVYEAPYQPDTGGTVDVAAPASGPQHQTLPSAPGTPACASWPLTASRAALSAAAASPLSGERK